LFIVCLLFVYCLLLFIFCFYCLLLFAYCRPKHSCLYRYLDIQFYSFWKWVAVGTVNNRFYPKSVRQAHTFFRQVGFILLKMLHAPVEEKKDKKEKTQENRKEDDQEKDQRLFREKQQELLLSAADFEVCRGIV
jgi:hypothetical protein